ncbi:RNA-binding KH domain-containing protein PEPPER-like [Panicum miliaceum]|uniref:RNA-binding KH domain-containing protein PEPPER-like n=1 Tax=Panicum miliaceum TaxID=4540 RepID=A0A3L6TD12_PANMI|nr:RNA-binding KH domain-containing protein PEPPER-like [Panicum miliaceum]
MAAAKPHFLPHAAFASPSSSPSPYPSAAGLAVFRLLLPPSFSDADTMRLYAAVNPLRRRTAALQVRVEPLDPASAGGRVVAAVLGPAAPVRRAEASSSSAEPLALSPAQEALVAVLDAEGALYRADQEGPRGGKGGGPPGCATCLLLVDAERLQAATAGGGVLGRIALEAGAYVRVVPWEEAAPQPQGQPPEEVVEITGDRTAVRKALVALSSRLQGDQPVDGSTTSVNKEGSTLPWASSEVPEPNVGILCSEASTEFAQGSVPKADCPEGNTGHVQSKGLEKVSFRLLLPTYLAGGLIGKKGLIIKGIEEETGACVDVGAPVTGCRERVITICALESPDSEYHIVQSALLLIFDRMMELERNTRSTFEKTSQFSARALVLKNQCDCLVGLGGSIIKEMITGELMNVRHALCLVCWKLRSHVFCSNGTDYNNGYIPSSDIAESNATSQANIYSTSQYSMDNAHKVDHEPSLSYGMDSVDKTFSSLELSSSEIQKHDNWNAAMIDNSDNGIQKPTEPNDIVVNNLNHGIIFPEENNLAREVQHAAITRITYETAVSGSILNLVYGDGNNLAQLTEISGADIAVYENEAMIMVSGPPDQAQSAQRMLVE